jgi:hypothetical protein
VTAPRPGPFPGAVPRPPAADSPSRQQSPPPTPADDAVTGDGAVVGDGHHPAVEAAVTALDGVDELSPREQVAAYTEVHRALQRTLNTIEEH